MKKTPGAFDRASLANIMFQAAPEFTVLTYPFLLHFSNQPSLYLLPAQNAKTPKSDFQNRRNKLTPISQSFHKWYDLRPRRPGR